MEKNFLKTIDNKVLDSCETVAEKASSLGIGELGLARCADVVVSIGVLAFGYTVMAHPLYNNQLSTTLQQTVGLLFGFVGLSYCYNGWKANKKIENYKEFIPQLLEQINSNLDQSRRWFRPLALIGGTLSATVAAYFVQSPILFGIFLANTLLPLGAAFGDYFRQLYMER